MQVVGRRHGLRVAVELKRELLGGEHEQIITQVKEPCKSRDLQASEGEDAKGGASEVRGEADGGAPNLFGALLVSANYEQQNDVKQT